MNVVWDTDTGTVTIVASTTAGPVNLSATTARHLIVRHRTTGVATELTIIASSLLVGSVTAVAQSLAAGEYDVILRVTDSAGTTTYPSADVGPARLRVRADIDAA
jgi:hypothetical protein